VGQGSVHAIVRARGEGGPFRTLGDLLRRVEIAAVNRRVLESLIQAGACDALGGDRAQLLEAVGDLLAQAQDRARNASKNQESLFGADHEIVTADPPLPLVPSWPLEERLRREREVLGFYFSDHPLSPYRAQIEARTTAETAGLRDLKDGAEVTMVCIVASKKAHVDRHQRPMAFLTLEDLKGSVEATVFSELYEKNRAILEVGSVLEVKGKVNLREDSDPKMLILGVKPLGSPSASAAGAVHIDLARAPEGVSLEEVRRLLVRHPGESPVYFTVRDDGAPAATRIRAKRLLVEPSEDLIRALRSCLGEDAVAIADGRAG
jgi:DNA polymerase-3 subunit alpha